MKALKVVGVVVALGLFLLVAMRLWSSLGMNPDGAESRAAGECGPRALGIAALRMGVPLEMDWLVDRCNPGPDGVSFARLQSIAQEQVGLQATLSRLTWQELIAQQNPCVVHLANDHFVTVDPRSANPEASEKTIEVLDIDGTRYWWNEADITERWSNGAALLLAHADDAASPIHIANGWQDFGAVVNEPIVTCAFEIENRGGEELQLAVADKSCGCTTATPKQQTIAPGEVGTVECRVRLDNKRGSILEQVTVEATGETHRRISLYFRGDVFNGPAIVPQRANVGDIMRGQSRTIPVVIRGANIGEKLNVTDVSVTALTEEADAEAAAAVDVTWDVEYLRDMPEERAVRWPQAGPFDAVVQVHAAAAKDSAATGFARKLEFVTNLPHGSLPTVVDLSGTVVPAVEYSPKALIVRADEHTGRSELKIRNLESHSLSVSSVELDNLPGLVVVEQQSTIPSERRYAVHVGKGAEVDRGRAGFLSIELGPGERIQVPVAFLASTQ